MGRNVPLLKTLLLLFLFIFSYGIYFPLIAEGVIKLSGTAAGVESEGSITTELDLGAVGMFSVYGGFKLTAQDLLEEDRQRIIGFVGFGLNSPSEVSFVFTDLAGIPAVGLLIEPHLFPYTGSILLMEKHPKIARILLDRNDTDFYTAGIVSKIPLGASGTIFPFVFTPLINPWNLHGFGAQAILHNPAGILTLGVCLAGRPYTADIPDELFYGGYPSRWGSFAQFSISTLPYTFNLPIVGKGEWESRFQIFGMRDGSLGEGLSLNTQVKIDVKSFSLSWDIQHLPIVLGTPGTVMPKVDTSILKETQVSLASAAGNLTVSWGVTDRVWRPSPYASEYQKRTVSTHAAIDWYVGDMVFGSEHREEVSWMVNGIVKRTGWFGLSFQGKFEDVRLVVKPAIAYSTDCAPTMKLDCTIGQRSDAGISWEAAIGCKTKTVKLALTAGYDWEGKQVKVECDSLRKLSLSLTIGR